MAGAAAPPGRSVIRTRPPRTPEARQWALWVRLRVSPKVSCIERGGFWEETGSEGLHSWLDVRRGWLVRRGGHWDVTRKGLPPSLVPSSSVSGHHDGSSFPFRHALSALESVDHRLKSLKTMSSTKFSPLNCRCLGDVCLSNEKVTDTCGCEGKNKSNSSLKQDDSRRKGSY